MTEAVLSLKCGWCGGYYTPASGQTWEAFAKESLEHTVACYRLPSKCKTCDGSGNILQPPGTWEVCPIRNSSSANGVRGGNDR